MKDSNKNSYDNMVVDIDRLFEKKIKKSSIARPSFLQKLLTRYINAFQIQDTIEAVEQRKDVLDYTNENYTTLYGELSYSQSMSNTVCRLK